MKRFYKTVGIRRAGATFAVTLDERPVKTPAGEMLALRSGALAQAIAAEWAGQGETIDQRTLVLTSLANTAVDHVTRDREATLRQVEGFARHDLVCYRAAEPLELVARESAAWDPPLAWVRTRHRLDLHVTTGVGSIAQPSVTFETVAEALARYDAYALTGLVTAAGIMKSLVLAFALADRRLDAAGAHEAAHVDELFQAEKWGLDYEAEARMRNLHAELAAAERFMRLAAA